MPAPKNFATFDIESTNWLHFEVLGLFDGKDYFNFWSIKQFLTHLNQKKYQGCRIYAHNGGKFDFLFLMQELFERGWIAKQVERQGRILFINVHTGKVSFTFADSYALLPSSLRNLCLSFKPKHYKGEIDYAKISAHDKETLAYLKNDCLSLWEILYDFFSSDYIGRPQLTIASQAMNTFNTFFFKGTIHQLPIRYEDMIRERFYSGGRVEMMKGYGKNINVYDVNSLYPFVMLGLMPTGEMKRTTMYKRGKIGFYNVRIKSTPDWYISPLIVRGSKLMFVNGAGMYYLGSPTLELLREMGVRFTIEQGWYFDGAEHLFVDYVNTFYNIKRKFKGTAMYYIAKLFLNSLYGKFGSKRERELLIPDDGYKEGCKPPNAGTLLDTYGMVYIKELSRSKFIAPYIAAYITELARVHHYRLMMQHPDEVYYCDTDSIFTTATYKTGTELGELSFEGKFKEGVFLGNKTYALRGTDHDKIAFKGFGTEDITFDMLKESLLKGKPISEKRGKILSYRECLNERKADQIEGVFLKRTTIVKTTSGVAYDKRKVVHSERYVIDTIPFQYKQIERFLQ